MNLLSIKMINFVTKIPLTMRLLFLSLFFSIGVSWANHSYAQSAQISIDAKNKSIAEILEAVEQQSEFSFIYDSKAVDTKRKVTVHAEEQSIFDVLGQMFTGSDIAYTVINKKIILNRSELMISLVQQGITVTGTVTENGTPMPGVNVVVKGTLIGQVTDTNGRYTITVPNSDAVLIFSFIGYMTQEFTVDNQTTINVSMAEDAAQIEEVVVVGYGTMRRSDMTGSVISVSADKLTAFPTMSTTHALQGRASGVQITSLNGAPGATDRIRIRGSSSLTAGNDPLWVVDGFAGGMVPQPEDIESIEILKDASAAAIYGSRAANGVILVTTKRGKGGSARVELNSSYGIETISKKIEMLNASEYGQLMNEIDKNAGIASPRFENWASLGEGTDWQDLIFRQGYRQNHQLSVSAGNDQLKSYTSLNYYDTDGIIINSNYKRFAASTNLEYNVKNRLKIGTSLRYTRSIDNSVITQEGSGGPSTSGVISTALRFEPTTPLYREDGVTYTVSQAGDALDNAYAVAKERIDERINDRFQGNVSGELKIFKGLTFTTKLNIYLTNDRRGQYSPTTINEGRSVSGMGIISTWKNTGITNENYFNYKIAVNNHRLDVMAGYSWQKQQNTDWNMNVQTFSTDQFLYWNMGSGTLRQSSNSGFNEWVIASFYGRLNYSFNDKYILTFTGRYDGSSRLGANAKWGFAPSGAFAWNIHNEQFMEAFNFLSQLKFRASYGAVGNTDISTYSSMARLQTVTTSINEQWMNGVRPNPANVANKDLAWEYTKSTNIGLDFGFFRNRLNINVDYYIKKTTDLLFAFPLPQYTGFSTATSNIADMENKGFELNINTVNFVKKDFYWATDFTFSTNKNKVVNLPVSRDIGILTNRKPGHITDFTETHILKEGLPVGSFYGYIFDGINPADGSIILRDIAGRDADNNLVMGPDGNVRPGDDRTVIGNPEPNFIFGFNNTFSYKNFDLNIFFQGVVGNDMYNFTRMEAEWLNGKTNQMKTVLKRWKQPGDITDFPKASNTNSASSMSRWIEKGTYARLQNLALGYNIQLAAFQNIGIERFRLYVSGQNLLTFTNYSGFDPEVGYANNNTTEGCDYGSYPRTRTVTFGLQLVF